MSMNLPAVIGCDFSSAPSRRKPIVVAHARLVGGRVVLSHVDTFDTLDTWAAWLAQPGDWVVVFQSGAYGASASPQAFLGHPSCAEVLV